MPSTLTHLSLSEVWIGGVIPIVSVGVVLVGRRVHFFRLTNSRKLPQLASTDGTKSSKGFWELPCLVGAQ